MKITMLRCGVCKFWYHLSMFTGKDGIRRGVHCRYCGSHPVYFRHWSATHFNSDGKQIVRAHHAGLCGTRISGNPQNYITRSIINRSHV
jgi:hypothetical protein